MLERALLSAESYSTGRVALSAEFLAYQIVDCHL